LDIWQADGPQMLRVYSFLPFAYGGWDIKWSRFVDDSHFILFGDGTLSGYRVGNAEPSWSWDIGPGGGFYGLSANRRYLAIKISTGIAVLDALTGKPFGQINLTLSKETAIAFKPDGSRLAVLSDGWLNLIDLSGASPIAEFSAIGCFGREVDWADEGYLLLDHSHLFSVTKQAVVWSYGGVYPNQHGASGAVLDDRLYYTSDRDYYTPDPVRREEHIQPMVGSVFLPDPEARGVLAVVGDPKMLFHPGMNVTLDVRLDGPARQSVIDLMTAKLRADGLGVADSQPIKIVIWEQPGLALDVRYRKEGAPGGAFENIRAQGVLRNLRILRADGQPIWGAGGSGAPPSDVTVKPGQSPEQAVAEQLKKNADSFYKGIRFPKLVPKSTGGFGMTFVDAVGTQQIADLPKR